MYNTKIIKIAITGVILLIIILTIILQQLNNTFNKTAQDNVNKTNLIEQYNNSLIITDTPETYIEMDKYIKESYKTVNYITSKRDYATISNIVNRYVNYIGKNNTNALTSILSTTYKNNYNFENETSILKINSDKEYYSIIITNMKNSQVDDYNNIYIVNGKGRISNKKNSEFDFCVLVEINFAENTYCVYPQEYVINKGYNNLKVGEKINFTAENIIPNEYNRFTYIKKTDEEMAKEYFTNFFELLRYHKKDAYNKLDLEYSNKRFGNEENFYNYLEENLLLINLAQINGYKKNSYREYTDYVCSDEYGNIYIFRQKDGIMNYTVFLDNYTIRSKEDTQYYNELDNLDKAKYNLVNFINMVNNKDYNAIYNCLENTFKQNNFTTINVLRNYLKNNLYDINLLQIEDIDEIDNDTGEYYAFTCTITNQLNKNQTANMSIIIKLINETNFTMSFSINE